MPDDALGDDEERTRVVEVLREAVAETLSDKQRTLILGNNELSFFLSMGNAPSEIINLFNGKRIHSFFIAKRWFNFITFTAPIPKMKSQLLVWGATTITHFLISLER